MPAPVENPACRDTRSPLSRYEVTISPTTTQARRKKNNVRASVPPLPPPLAPLALTSLTPGCFFVQGVCTLAPPGRFYFFISDSSETLDGVFLDETATRGKYIFRTTRSWERGWSLVPPTRVLSASSRFVSIHGSIDLRRPVLGCVRLLIRFCFFACV